MKNTGLEPITFGAGIQRATNCANSPHTQKSELLYIYRITWCTSHHPFVELLFYYYYHHEYKVCYILFINICYVMYE